MKSGRCKIMLMGPRRSGKSSILQVVFHKMSPNETLFLESTKSPRETTPSHAPAQPSTTFMHFQLLDHPGHADFLDAVTDAHVKALFADVKALIFVVDAQDDYVEALAKLYSTLVQAYKVYPDIHFEVFIHKVDGLSDDHKIDTQRDITQRITDELMDAGLEQVMISFYLTSIYDHSIFEAFSKVIQKLMPHLSTLENLLNLLCSHTAIDKAFLFDCLSKIYVATDSSPVDMQTYELCSDMIDVVLDVSSIYSNATMEAASGIPSTAIKPDAQNLTLTPPSWSLSSSTAFVPFDEASMAMIRLNNGMVLLLRQATRSLALVGLARSDHFLDKRGLVEYNVEVFRNSLRQVFFSTPE